MFSNILVVCSGNICRSPVGARLLQQLLPHANVDSAGTMVERCRLTHQPADYMANEAAAVIGVNLDGHHAKQLTISMCATHSLILVMEQTHQRALTKLAAEVRGKTMLFGHWLGGIDIPDPYRQSREAFTHSFALIEQSAQQWAKKLENNNEYN